MLSYEEILKNIPESLCRNKIILIIKDNIDNNIPEKFFKYNCTIIQSSSNSPKDILCRLFSFSDVVISDTNKKELISEDDAYQYFKDNRHDFYGNFSNKRDRIILDLSNSFSEDFKKSYSNYY